MNRNALKLSKHCFVIFHNIIDNFLNLKNNLNWTKQFFSIISKKDKF